ncbi:MAG: ATP-binding protein, partial [Bacteroidota bacterium]
YIGETEKNLENLFKVAENRNWILFFDEAESLFAKRSSVKQANDQYANQTVGYLLQRVEDYNGVIILCTNKPTNMDEAFTRRFQSIITFPAPSDEDRLRLWQNLFVESDIPLENSVDLDLIAKTYASVTGGMLINILRTCIVKVMTQEKKVFRQEDIIEAIRKEYEKHRHMWVKMKGSGKE